MRFRNFETNGIRKILIALTASERTNIRCHIDANCSAVKTSGLIFVEHRFPNRHEGIKQFQESLSSHAKVCSADGRDRPCAEV